MKGRVKCPCCGYPTLPERANYEICELCNWEDDGQDDEDADEVMGGPNSDYSLTEARENFRRYMVMYAPGRDQRLTGEDSELQRQAKIALVGLFDRHVSASESERVVLEAEIFGLERQLFDEVVRHVREYESRSAKE